MKFTAFAATLIAAFCFTTTALGGGLVLRAGSSSPAVLQLENYLHSNVQSDYYKGVLDGIFGRQVNAGLRGWQSAAGYKPTGTITFGSRQWNTLRSQATVTRLAGYISQAAINGTRQTGWAVDASKSPSIVTVLHYVGGIVQATASIAASYGDARGPLYVTTPGVFTIYAQMGYDFYSRKYDNAPMHWAACFNGGQCLHYDPLTTSHGCIHIPSMPLARFIGSLPVGTTVVVHD
jgi:hypothetical protein